MSNKISDQGAFVDWTTVPQHNHMSSQMSQQITKEPNHLNPGEVLGMEADIQSQTFPLGRNRDAGDGGDFVPPVAMSEKRRLTDWRPGLANIRDKQKAGFIEKCQMGPKFLSFYLAIPASSIWLSLARPSGWLAARASSNSTPAKPLTSKHLLSSSWPQNVSLSARRYALRSIGLCCNLPPTVLAKSFTSLSFCHLEICGGRP